VSSSTLSRTPKKRFLTASQFPMVLLGNIKTMPELGVVESV
jgi:hypothetical protein